jgi:hypothetical protein
MGGLCEKSELRITTIAVFHCNGTPYAGARSQPQGDPVMSGPMRPGKASAKTHNSLKNIINNVCCGKRDGVAVIALHCSKISVK